MERLGIDPQSIIGVRVAECGFDPYERDDGLHAIGPDGRYDRACRATTASSTTRAIAGDNPWHDFANAAEGEGNTLASGWAMRHARKPARVREEDSETPVHDARARSTSCAKRATQPWCLHLSYIKPHWPYIAPAPYHAMYGPDDVIPAVRSEKERARSASGLSRIHGPSGEPRFLARRGAQRGDPGLHGPDQADRRPARLAVRFHARARTVRQHDDRVHVRPRRLSRRPLAGRKGPVPRAVGEECR